jgi:hypothetical protein
MRIYKRTMVDRMEKMREKPNEASNEHQRSGNASKGILGHPRVTNSIPTHYLMASKAAATRI